MKLCPICQSVAFDDAQTCYGCLHEFTGDETVAAAMPQPAETDGPPSFVIQIRPEREGSGLTSWTCKVDLVPA